MRPQTELMNLLRKTMQVEPSLLIDIWYEYQQRDESTLKVFAEWCYCIWFMQQKCLARWHTENKRQAKKCMQWLKHRSESELDDLLVIDLAEAEVDDENGFDMYALLTDEETLYDSQN